MFPLNPLIGIEEGFVKQGEVAKLVPKPRFLKEDKIMKVKEMVTEFKNVIETRAKDIIETQKALGMDDSFSGDRCRAVMLEAMIDAMIYFEVLPEETENPVSGKVSKTKALLLFVLTNELRDSEGKKGREAGFPVWLTQTSTIQKKAIDWKIYPEREKKAKDETKAAAPKVDPMEVLNNL